LAIFTAGLTESRIASLNVRPNTTVAIDKNVAKDAMRSGKNSPSRKFKKRKIRLKVAINQTSLFWKSIQPLCMLDPVCTHIKQATKKARKRRAKS
jgi:hypothetical protein